MNTADVLHDTAMNYYDLGKIAKAKGKPEVYQDYLSKAFVLDKEAAIKKYQEGADFFWKYVYLRSAAWLAIDCEKWEDAEILATLGLQGKPPTTEATQFKNILKQVKEHKITTKSTKKIKSNWQQIIGVFTSADVANAYIIINGGQPSALKISVSSEKVDELVKLFWGTTVEVSGEVKKDGHLILEHIRKAA